MDSDKSPVQSSSGITAAPSPHIDDELYHDFDDNSVVQFDNNNENGEVSGPKLVAKVSGEGGQGDGEEEWSELLEALDAEDAVDDDRFLESLETPVIDEGVNETPIVDKGVEEKPIVEKGVDETPIVNKGVEEKPIVDKGVDETPVVDKGVDGTPVVDKGVEEKQKVEALNVDKGVNETSNVDKGVDETANVDRGVDGTPVVDKGVEEEQKVESLEPLNVGKGVDEERDVESLKVGDELEGDAIVDSIKVDVVEVIRSGVAVVGVDDKTEKEVASVEKDSSVVDVVESPDVVAEDNKEIKDSGGKVVDSNEVVPSKVVAEDNEGIKDSGGEVVDSNEVVPPKVVAEDNEGIKDSEVEESASVDSAVVEAAGVKLTDEGDAIVDSINVDVAEAVRSGTAIVGEVGEARESGTEVENSVIEDSVPESPKAVEADEVKFVDESDSVVDKIQVDVVEAVRSGVAVVGEPKLEDAELEEKEVVAPVGKNVAVANDFAPLTVSNSDEVVGEPSDKQVEAQTNEAEALQSVEKQNTEATNSDIKKSEPSEPDASSLVEGVKTSNRSYADVLVEGLDIAAPQLEKSNTPDEIEVNAEDEIHVAQENGDDEGSNTDDEDGRIYFGGRSSARQVMENGDDSEMIDGQVVTESEEEGDSDEEGEGNELFDSAALAALLKAATGAGADPGTITVRSPDGSRLFSMERPAGLEPSLRSARSTIGSNASNFFTPSNLVPASDENLSEDDKKKLQNLQQLKVKFLRLVQRVGFTAEHSLAAQVLYKLTVFAGRPVSPAFSLDNAKQTATQLEAEGKDDLDFFLNILVLGKTGVGKSAIINSIFGEEKVKINAFEPETTSVNQVFGVVDGIRIRFIDAPGLKSSATDQGFNRKVLASVNKLIKKCPPDVVFYVDRLDSQTRDLNDLPLLKTISNSLGSSIWRNAIITLTHASSAPPDGPSGTPLSYEVFVAQRSHIVQQLVAQAVGDMRLMNLNMMNPVSLVENHPACRKNRDGQKILPNGQAWRPQLLLLCYSVKILAEASANSKSQDAFDARKLFGFRSRSPPLPYLLSSLLQPRAHPKLAADQGGDNVDSDIDLDDVSDSDEEEGDEYDQLPPFKPLKKSQLAKLSGEQKKAYFEEYDYRVKLLQRKQWREELKRMREMKNGKNSVDAYGEMPEDYDGENGAPAAVQVPLPDMTLPPSFDSDNPAYRYRFLEPTSQFLARPVLDPHGWDHDCGYEGVNIEQNMGIAGRFPASYTVQLTKDKKDFNVHLDSALSAKHGENGSSLVGFDVQTIGKQYAYIVRGETKFKNMKKNKTAAGVTVTFLGENVATGVKVEDQIMLGKRLVLVGSTGTVRSQKDAAYGANMEVRLREADYPIGQEQSSFTLSLMKWRGDLAVGGNLQSQVSVGRNSKVAVRAALNNKMSGQITVRTSSSDHLSLALAGLMPIAIAIYQKIRPGVESENYSIY